MDRRSIVFGFAAGAIFALAAVVWVSAGKPAVADPPAPPPPVVPPLGQPPGMADPVDPTSPGRSINPSTGGGSRGLPNPGQGTAAWNNRAIALAGSVGGGETVVYYFDTEAQRLLIYQYRTGERGGVSLLAARHFDMDLKLEGYRDRSEKSRNDLKADYEKEFPPGAQPPSDDLPTKKVEINPPK